MLQQILKDMYIEPDVLNALNEEQKKTLFLKMREEQVRRWKEREEKMEREGGDTESKRTKPRKANSKSVSWLLGRDGDVSVSVIGEVDELTSKFICSGLGEKKSPNLQNNTCHQTILKSRKITDDVRTERENLPPKTHPGISLNFKGKCEVLSTELPLPVSVSEHTPATAKEKLDLKSASTIEEKSDTQTSICSRPPMRVSPVNIKPASTNATLGCVNTRPGLTHTRLAATTTSSSISNTVKIVSGSTSLTQDSLCSKEPQKPHESQGGKDVGVLETTRTSASGEVGASGRAAVCTGRGRVAQLMKTFSADTPTQTPPRGVKPPLPTKPNHLHVVTTSTVR